ncbi:membrane hypothetical protein [Desulfamplus magnetovallimortis]|uniref:Uncharacterized protein n=1 Tax=Desulfamplus magnetovallimortis TaxID=1246637 RepID=A0A1W1HC74_9BACT|nr:exosortase H-associated membrane protein [Desulfamplus magnetovallimortis]SLM29985.1 membrane hypothetical protein [Desulfamplus magnetovallimortis]
MFQTKKILFSLLIFATAYIISLIIWIQIKPYYGNVMTRSGSECAALFSSFRLDNFVHDNEIAKINFSRLIYSHKGLGDLVIDLQINVSNYSFNIPLTIALILSLLPIVKWWNPRTIIEVVIILLVIHFCYVFFYTSLQLFYYSHPGVRQDSFLTTLNQYFLEFMWMFIDNMVVRFEPFLVALYIFFRNQATKKITSKKIPQR